VKVELKELPWGLLNRMPRLCRARRRSFSEMLASSEVLLDDAWSYHGPKNGSLTEELDLQIEALLKL